MGKERDRKSEAVRLPALRREDRPVAGKKEDLLQAGQILQSGLQEVEVRITVEWGRTAITVEEALKLSRESLLKVEQMADDPVDIRVNGKLFGRGKLVLVGGNYGVQITEIVGPEGD